MWTLVEAGLQGESCGVLAIHEHHGLHAMGRIRKLCLKSIELSYFRFNLLIYLYICTCEINC
jgi:hypothetical protein